MVKKPLFENLIFNEVGEPVGVAYVGDEPCYTIPEYGFLRHVPARDVDQQILTRLRDQMLQHRDLVTAQILELLGRDDLFTKAAVDATLQNLDKQVDQMMEFGLPEEARLYLGMMGFRATVNVHGELVDLNLPVQELPEE
ncbi:MAG: hypothetical protein H5T65_07755 [Chloroflexi bacterium]|nr:hypothetical protein [Chloroflexota bacterium]